MGYYKDQVIKRDDDLNTRQKAANILLRTCVTCDMFNLEGEICTRWNARPPAKVIAYGCDQYIEEIPF